MALTTRIKDFLNRLLRLSNLRLDTLTIEKLEASRLSKLAAAGHFEKPVFPILDQFKDCDPASIFAEVAKHEKRFAEFAATPKGGQKFSFDNEYFSSPDAEVLYAMVRLYRPRNIIEVGSGNSTLLFRQAITDAMIETRLVSIDPYPRREIAQYSDDVITERVENLSDLKRLAGLKANDILFIDSSHEVKAGNDVVFLLLNVLPQLPVGVVVHVHDIFLPFEYPEKWVRDFHWGWTEQYLLQAMLAFGDTFEVVCPGHYLQRTLPDFARHFPNLNGGTAKSLWLRKLKP